MESTSTSQFKATRIIQGGRTDRVLTADELYWKRLETVGLSQECGHVTSLDFSPLTPHTLAATCSTKVTFYDSASFTVSTVLSRFKRSVVHAVYRADGKLLATGGEEGRLRVFETENTASHVPLRFYKAHARAVHSCTFTACGKRLVSFSDDGALKLWDLAGTDSVPLRTFTGHNDVVRTGCADRLSGNLIISGSYDHTARVWDTRVGTDASQMELDHGRPIEHLLLFPNETLLATAGGTVVKLWDISSGGRQLAQISNHHRTVTQLRLCSNGSRLASAGLDGMLNLYELTGYRHVHSIKYTAPILSMAILHDDSLLAVGLTTGNQLLLQRRRGESADQSSAAKTKNRFLSTSGALPTAPTRRRRKSRGEEVAGSAPPDFGGFKLPSTDNLTNDLLVTRKTDDRLQRYDRHMKAFRHSKALDCVVGNKFLVKTRPQILVSVLRELVRRGALAAALAGRTEQTIDPLLRFIARHIRRPRFARTLLTVSHTFLDVYRDRLDKLPPETLSLIRRLKGVVANEVDEYRRIVQLSGAVELLINQHATATDQESVLEKKALFSTSVLGDPIVRHDIAV